MRLEGRTFEDIGAAVSLSERQVRRQYEDFLLANNEVYRTNKRYLFGQIFAQFENALETANKQLTESMSGDNPAKIAVWHKIRQECLRDYYGFLKDLGLGSYWTDDPNKKETDIDRLRSLML